MKTTFPLMLVLLAACGPGEAMVLDDGTGEVPAAKEVPLAAPNPLSEDRRDTVDVGSWNVEWYGDPSNGPGDEAVQQANAAKVLGALQLDLVGLVEVVSEEAFAALVAKLPGYAGLIVTDPRVANGRAFYSAKEQKVALIYKKRFTVDAARVVVTEAAFAFGGRPPMEVKLSFSETGRARTLVVLVAHFKAMANWDGYTRRKEAAVALKAFLDTEYPARWVLTVGDLNDDLDRSTYRGYASPFAPILADTAAYRFTTDALTAAEIPTTVGFSSTIDHHLATNELAERFVEGSAKVLRVDGFVPEYGTTTSDHYPVLTRYDLR